ncbi:MAG: SusD/RagB family nutrient-binding outer membrane lipoprotein [Bacteroidia bacterium]
MLAEAAQRGWIGGDAEQYFNNGVRAHMEQLSAYGANTTVAPAECH